MPGIAGKEDGSPPFRILHLSDIHLAKKTRWDADGVLQSLTEKIKLLVEEGLPPDVIAITGDIVFSGRKEEYDSARRWIDDGLLKATGVPAERVLIIPGNHDVNRGGVSKATQTLQSALLAEKSQDEIANALRSRDDRGVLLKRHAAYMKFAAAYGPAAAARKKPAVPWWSYELAGSAGGPGVFFAGLCSSWMSCGDEDHGRLLLGRYQVNEVFAKVPKDAIVVTLVHHPWSFLAEFDGVELQESVYLKSDVVLRGHLHAQRSSTIHDPDNGCVELAAGCVYDGSRFANAFQLIDLWPAQKRIAVHYYLWHKDAWIKDRNAYQSAPEGIAEFELKRSVKSGPKREGHTPPPDPNEYLRRLRAQTEFIDIRGLKVGSGKATRLRIDELYIPLATTGTSERPDKQKDPGKIFDEEEYPAREFGTTDLRKALEHRCLVVVGDPGSGKSTFMRLIAFELCEQRLAAGAREQETEWKPVDHCLPILIPLGGLASYMRKCRERGAGLLHDDGPQWLAEYAAAECEVCADTLNASFFTERLKAADTIVLLDGLDEAPTEAERKSIRQLIEKASRAYPKCRFVVTSRPAAYKGEAVLEGEFKDVRVAPLSEEAIENFLAAWCRALWGDNENEANRHRSELNEPIRRITEIRKMARNPVMLTALAVVHWNEKRLPEQRAHLYDSIIGWLAKARESKPGRPPPDRSVTLLQELALAMHDHPNGRQTQISRHAGARAVAPAFRELPDEGQRIARAEQFLREEEADSGIVVGRGEHDVRFWHLTFQEYLAARALADREDAEVTERLLRSDKLYRPEWREVVLLFAGSLGSRRVDAMFRTILAELGPEAKLEVKARCAGLLGAVLQDLSPVSYRPPDGQYDKLLEEVTAVFDAKRSPAIPIEEAIQAAEAIGQAGDLRFTDLNSPKLWVDIPAGSFWMGAQKQDKKGRNFDPDAWDKDDWSESPVHKVTLGAYRIGRYPVTVVQYRRFIEEGGYTSERYWTAGGFGTYKSPGDWDEQVAYPTRPVVNVSWYEASAYAAWTGGRLPTEAQWERVARGQDGRRFPWGGEEPNPRLLNFVESKNGHATPVGIYPLGASPEGAVDMAGNVWEWCADWHSPYSADDQTDPIGPGEGSSRVLRGGAWGDGGRYCRSANRSRLTPDYRARDFGFRVVSSGLAPGTH